MPWAVLLGGLLVTAVPSESAAPARPATLAVVPIVATDERAQDSVVYVQHHVVYWLRQWGQLTDDPEAIVSRIGVEGLGRLVACASTEKCGVKEDDYQAVLSGQLSVEPGGKWKLSLVVTSSAGEPWMTVVSSAPSLAELLNELINKTQIVADGLAARTGRSLKYDPPTRPYGVGSFIFGGAALATGVTFFLLSSSENSKLSNPSQPLAAAVVALFLYQPGARPPGVAVTVDVDPSRGLLLLSGRFP